MVIFLRFIVVLMGLSMFFISRERKIALLLIYSINLTLVDLFDKPGVFFLVVFFVLSEIPNKALDFKKIRESFIGNIFYIFCLSAILAIIFSPHLHTVKSAYNFVLSDLLLRKFALIYAFVVIKNEKHLRSLIRFSIIPVFILTLIGAINMVDHESLFVTKMTSHMNSFRILSGDHYTDSGRFRVQAMFNNPFDYGYICCMLLYLYLYAYLRKLLKSYLFFILLLCCLFGVIMCGARTVFFCTFIGVIIFFHLTYKFNKRIFFRIAIFLLICVVAYESNSVVRERFNQLMFLFSDVQGDEYAGSSVDMRSVQFAAVMKHINNSMLFGRGVHFFGIDLGWSTGNAVDEDLAGLESVLYSYLLERGFAAYIFYLVVLIQILLYLINARKIDLFLANLGITICLVYILFANMTGEMLSVYPTSLIIGCILGILYEKKKMHEN